MVKQILECRKWSMLRIEPIPFWVLITFLPYHVLCRWQSLFSFQNCSGKRSNKTDWTNFCRTWTKHTMSVFSVKHPGISFSVSPNLWSPSSHPLCIDIFVHSVSLVKIYLMFIPSSGGSSDPLGAPPANALFEVLPQCSTYSDDWLTLPPVRFSEDQLPFSLLASLTAFLHRGCIR